MSIHRLERSFPIDWAAIGNLKKLLIENPGRADKGILGLINTYAKNIFLQIQQEPSLTEEEKETRKYTYQQADVLCLFGLLPERFFLEAVETSIFGKSGEMQEVGRKISCQLMLMKTSVISVKEKAPWFEKMISDFTAVFFRTEPPLPSCLSLSSLKEKDSFSQPVLEGKISKILSLPIRFPTPAILEETDDCDLKGKRTPSPGRQSPKLSFPQILEELRAAVSEGNQGRAEELKQLFIAKCGPTEANKRYVDEFYLILEMNSQRELDAPQTSPSPFLISPSPIHTNLTQPGYSQSVLRSPSPRPCDSFFDRSPFTPLTRQEKDGQPASGKPEFREERENFPYMIQPQASAPLGARILFTHTI